MLLRVVEQARRAAVRLQVVFFVLLALRTLKCAYPFGIPDLKRGKEQDNSDFNSQLAL